MTSPSTFDSVDMEELLFPILERLEKKDFNLPILPQIANQVLALITDPEANASQLTRLIQQDPLLTAKLLKTANSAGCGAVRQIESVAQAVRVARVK
jgi:HD-like signal output (HDOD) protein